MAEVNKNRAAPEATTRDTDSEFVQGFSHHQLHVVSVVFSPEFQPPPSFAQADAIAYCVYC